MARAPSGPGWLLRETLEHPPSRGWPEESPGAQAEQREAERCSRRPALAWHPWLCRQHGWERAPSGPRGHMTTAGGGQPSPAPGPALTPGRHLELCDVVNFLCQNLCTACQPDYCGDRNQQGGARSWACHGQEGGRTGMPLIFAPHRVQPLWLQAWPKSHKPVPNSLQK